VQKGQFIVGALFVRQRGGDGVRGSKIEVFGCDSIGLCTKAHRNLLNGAFVGLEERQGREDFRGAILLWLIRAR
jgi:hypothetical protein